MQVQARRGTRALVCCAHLGQGLEGQAQLDPPTPPPPRAPPPPSGPVPEAAGFLVPPPGTQHQNEGQGRLRPAPTWVSAPLKN